MISMSRFARVSLLDVSIILLVGCGGSSGGGGGGGTCSVGNEGCACYPNRTCNSAALSCLSNICVSLDPPGGGGTSGGPSGSGGGAGTTSGPGGTGATSEVPGVGGSTHENGGAPSTGGLAQGSGGVPGTGGISTQGSGGAPGTGGTPSRGGAPGSGGALSSGGSSGGGTVLDGCNNASASVLDNFATCDTTICNLGGRNGVWFSYSSNNNIGIQCSAQVPPVSWIDRSCGYYCTNGVAGATWAGAGFDLKDPSGAYNLSSYSGVYVKIETGQTLTVAIKDLAGNTWRSAPVGGGSGAATHTIAFASMNPDTGTTGAPNLSQIVGFRFDADPKTISAFGFAIHAITLY